MNASGHASTHGIIGPTGPISMPAATVVAVCLVCAIAATDLVTSSVNLSIVYCLPMAIFARTARPALIWRIAALLVVLGYAGYLLGPWPADTPTWHAMLLRFRMVNRGFSAAAVLLIAAMSHLGIAMRRRMDSRWEPRSVREADREVFLEIVASFEQFQAIAMSVIATTLIAVVDLLTPAQFNPAILYAVPVLAAARARSRVFLWTLVVAAIALIHVGFKFGPGAQLDPDLIPRIIRNRRITAAMVLGVGAFAHLMIDIDHPRRRAGTAGAGGNV